MKFCLSLKNNYIIEKKVRLMESKIIKAFFDRNLVDEVITTPRTKEYTDIDERETAIYNKLRPMLTVEQLKLFDEFVDLYGDRHAIIYLKATTFAALNSVCASPWNVLTSPTWTKANKIS